MRLASFLDWSMRDPRALAIVVGLFVLVVLLASIPGRQEERALRRRLEESEHIFGSLREDGLQHPECWDAAHRAKGGNDG